MRQSIFRHLESPLTGTGVVLWLLIVAYIFGSIVVFATKDRWLGGVLFSPVLVASSYLAFREALGFRLRFPRAANLIGLLHALAILLYLAYIGTILIGAVST